MKFGCMLLKGRFLIIWILSEFFFLMHLNKEYFDKNISFREKINK